VSAAAEDAFAGFMEGEKTTGKKAASALGVLGLGGLDMAGRSSGASKEVTTAKLLVGPNLAVASEFPTYAFSSSRFTSESNVTVSLDSSNKDPDAAHISLTFGYFPQGLFYDPTMFFSHSQDMLLPSSYVASGVTPTAPAASQNCTGNETDCGTGSRSRRRANSASSQRGGSGMLLQALSAAAALALVFVL
jgi:hypothetical protein